jgi:DNA-binding protein HU-beta
MTKKELVSNIAEKVAVSKSEVNVIISKMIEEVNGALIDGQSVYLSGLCNFKLETQPAKEGVIPGTTTKYKSPKKTVVRIKPCKTLKDDLIKTKIK